MNAPPSAPGRMVDRRTMARLRARAERRVRIAIMGEFSAGKSTLLNALVGRPVAPIRVTATQASPLWVSRGETASAEIFGQDGTRRAVEVDDIQKIDAERVRLVRLRLPTSGLERFDVIDTPGLLDPLLSEDVLHRAARLADMAIWCTSAVQAWRRSEEAAWSSLPERLRRESVLVVTHADRLSERDQGRVLARLGRETEGLFRERLLVSSSQAARARIEGPAEGWETSGAARLQAVLEGLVGEIEERRRARLSRYAVEAGQPPPEEPVAPPAPASVPPPAPAKTPSREVGTPLEVFDAAREALPAAPSPEALRDLARRVVRLAEAAGGDRPVWSQLLLTHRFDAVEPRRLLRQMRGEVADFAADDWSDLAPASSSGPSDGA